MQKQYEQAMKKADELETAGKFKEAWMKVPQTDLLHRIWHYIHFSPK